MRGRASASRSDAGTNNASTRAWPPGLSGDWRSVGHLRLIRPSGVHPSCTSLAIRDTSTTAKFQPTIVLPPLVSKNRPGRSRRRYVPLQELTSPYGRLRYAKPTRRGLREPQVLLFSLKRCSFPCTEEGLIPIPFNEGRCSPLCTPKNRPKNTVHRSEHRPSLNGIALSRART